MANNNNDTQFLDDWRRWRSTREAAVTAPYGPLSPVGMGWLEEQPSRIDEAPGRWSLAADGVRLELDSGDNPRYDCQALNPDHQQLTVTLPIPDTAGYVVENGDTRVEVVRRGNRVLIRPRDPGNAEALGYRETPTFEPNPDWVITAEFQRYEESMPVTVGAVAKELVHSFNAVGELVFALDGHTHKLQAFATGDPKEVQVIFTDATSGDSTWRDNRQVIATLDSESASTASNTPGAIGATIDFNRATNFPGAYTPHATCPLPPAGNHLDLAVTAGEQIPAHRRP